MNHLRSTSGSWGEDSYQNSMPIIKWIVFVILIVAQWSHPWSPFNVSWTCCNLQCSDSWLVISGAAFFRVIPFIITQSTGVHSACQYIVTKTVLSTCNSLKIKLKECTLILSFSLTNSQNHSGFQDKVLINSVFTCSKTRWVLG